MGNTGSTRLGGSFQASSNAATLAGSEVRASPYGMEWEMVLRRRSWLPYCLALAVLSSVGLPGSLCCRRLMKLARHQTRDKAFGVKSARLCVATSVHAAEPDAA